MPRFALPSAKSQKGEHMGATCLPNAFVNAREPWCSQGRPRIILLALLLLGIFLPSNAPAQVYSGSLTGVATDPSGGVLPGARAVLTDEQKGFTFAAVTDTEGRYVLRNLPPGTYTLSASAR